MPRYSLSSLFALMTAVALALAFPDYIVRVTVLFMSVLFVLVVMGALMGPLPEEKLAAFRRHKPNGDYQHETNSVD
jgi:hypothetical protein